MRKRVSVRSPSSLLFLTETPDCRTDRRPLPVLVPREVIRDSERVAAGTRRGIGRIGKAEGLADVYSVLLLVARLGGISST